MDLCDTRDCNFYIQQLLQLHLVKDLTKQNVCFYRFHYLTWSRPMCQFILHTSNATEFIALTSRRLCSWWLLSEAYSSGRWCWCRCITIVSTDTGVRRWHISHIHRICCNNQEQRKCITPSLKESGILILLHVVCSILFFKKMSPMQHTNVT
jgi:hypothetical protein